MRLRHIASLLAAFVTGPLAAAPIPVVYSTDLMHPHDDPDDHFDLACLYAMPEADVPFHWIPCFDGGPWTNNGHASFWRIKQGEVLNQTPEPLQRYFLYMLRQATNDPIAYLTQPARVEDRDWLMGGPRNLWCGALLGLAVGRPLLHEGNEVVGFSPVELSVDDTAVVRYGRAPGSRVVMRFEIRNRTGFAGAATRATARLLESFPLRDRP